MRTQMIKSLVAAVFAASVSLGTAVEAQPAAPTRNPAPAPARTPAPTPRTVPAAPAGTPAAVAKAAIDVNSGWVRATPTNNGNAAVYLQIVNAGADADALVGVESPNAAHAMVHTTTVANGTASMAMTPSVPIPGKSTVTFGPNGRHIMLEGLKAPLREGESFIITLNFTKAGKVSATVKVLGVAASGPTGAH